MALYNFQKRFAPAILDGTKRHTIRAKRARSTESGETLHLYTGLRQKGAQLLMRAPCTLVQDIRILGGHTKRGILPHRIFIDGVELSADECEQLARADGFTSRLQMVAFWRGRTPFEGDIIHWQYPPPQNPQEKYSCANASAPVATTRSGARTVSARKNAAAPTTTKAAARCGMPSALGKAAAQPAAGKAR